MNAVEASRQAEVGARNWDDAKRSVALDDLPDGVLVVSRDGRIEFWGGNFVSPRRSFC